MRLRLFLGLFTLALVCCRGKGGDDEGVGPTNDEPAPVQVPADLSAGTESPVTLSWGPEPVSSEDRTADGISTSLGVGQVGVVWIENRDPGADVFMALVADDAIAATRQVTRGASAYPPTAVAWSGKDFTLAWGDDRYRHIEIFVARVGWNGKLALKPRRLTDTKPAEDDSAGVFSADSSQQPTLAYYGGQLIAAWGGPGRAGRQQVYYTTLSSSGKPNFDPEPITSGLTDAVGIRLRSHEKGAVLAYGVQSASGTELYRLPLAGNPPEPSQPFKVETSAYVPACIDHVVGRDRILVAWAYRKEPQTGIFEDVIRLQPLGSDGSYAGEEIELDGPRLVKYPGRHHRPFDGMSLGDGRFCIAWLHRENGGETSLRVGFFDEQGKPIGSDLEIPAQADPTDPHVLPTGQPGGILIVWLDRPVGAKSRRVYVASLRH